MRRNLIRLKFSGRKRYRSHDLSIVIKLFPNLSHNRLKSYICDNFSIQFGPTQHAAKKLYLPTCVLHLQTLILRYKPSDPDILGVPRTASF